MKIIVVVAVGFALSGCSLIPREYQDDIRYRVLCTVARDAAYVINPLGLSGRVHGRDAAELCKRPEAEIVPVLPASAPK